MEFKKINLSEDTISMILGLAIVVLVVGLIFNFFQRSRGSVSVPGVSNIPLTESQNQAEVKEEAIEGSQVPVKEYTVRTGDSLWKIAQAVYGDGNKWVDVAAANKIKNPSMIHSDLVLKMPEIEQKETLAQTKITDPKTEEYTVIRGDNLWKISVAQYGDGFAWQQVYTANRASIRNPDKLEIGMKLRMPRYTPRL